VHVVFDASVVVRALLGRQTDAVGWLARLESGEVTVAVPDLLFAEVGQALRGYVISATVSARLAAERLRFVLTLPLETRSLGPIAVAATSLALERGLSVYDAFYAVVAQAEDALLVTADRTLAAAVPRAELLPKRSSPQGP
jgi:predicted nucleic acid-binding protein